jgi:hypothetical protein
MKPIDPIVRMIVGEAEVIPQTIHGGDEVISSIRNQRTKRHSWRVFLYFRCTHTRLFITTLLFYNVWLSVLVSVTLLLWVPR